jgi:hypothetical protein
MTKGWGAGGPGGGGDVGFNAIAKAFVPDFERADSHSIDQFIQVIGEVPSCSSTHAWSASRFGAVQPRGPSTESRASDRLRLRRTRSIASSPEAPSNGWPRPSMEMP